MLFCPYNESQWVQCGVNNNAAILITIALRLQVHFEDLLQVTEDIFDVDLFSCHTSLSAALEKQERAKSDQRVKHIHIFL